MQTQTLINYGQATFIYKLLSSKNINPSFILHDEYKYNGLKIELTKENLQIHSLTPYFMLADPSNQTGYIPDWEAPYWFSLDTQNLCLYAGIGEPRLETVKYTYKFSSKGKYKKMLESLSHIEYDTTQIQCIKILKDPITIKIPLLVKDTNDLTMDDIAKSKYMPTANLSLISQKMYYCISGKKFVLNTSDFPNFSDAIEHSIRTPGCWCNTTLKNKSTEFNKDKPNLKETYLRITLGQNNGESPGIPYVMEIWPVGHYSPVHSHAGAEAVIRVLHGSIHVKLFPYLSDQMNVAPFGTCDFKEGDITWISPTLNQTHQLVNLDKNTETCITIQCYMYDGKDNSHYDYFDYIDGNRIIQQYEPDLDMDFVAFKELMRKEWNAKK